MLMRGTTVQEFMPGKRYLIYSNSNLGLILFDNLLLPQFGLGSISWGFGKKLALLNYFSILKLRAVLSKWSSKLMKGTNIQRFNSDKY